MNNYNELFVSMLFFVSAFFIFLSTLGFKRLPDFYCRMHAATKASTIAKVFSFSAAALYYIDDSAVKIKILCILIFFFLSSPVGAHLLARAAYKSKVSKCKETWVDEYKDK